ncbi:hypothetical protein Tco_1007113 [Tanacetum coccineum]
MNKNTSVEPVVDGHIKNWVTTQLDLAMDRIRAELRTVLNKALSGTGIRSMGTVRPHGEGTSREGRPPHFTIMTKIEFLKFRGEDIDVELAVRMFRPNTLAEVYYLSKIQQADNKVNKQRVTGHVGKHNLHILEDIGSTHNFLDIDKAKKLGCHLSNTCLLQVDITAGAKLTIYFQEIGMEFKYKGRNVALRGTKKPALQWMEGVKVLVHNAQLSSMVLCVYSSTSLNMISAATKEGTPIPTSISNVFSYFKDVFVVATALPPIRDYDHKIVLKKGTKRCY